ncbi:hypothetical protein JG688_00007065, partial [Phytophthora aleatoria]
MSSSSPTFSAPEHDSVDWRQIEMQLPPTEARKKNETEEERQRRRSASYAHMLVRMRRHYDTVQVNGTHGPPVTAPPRRIRAERRAKSVAVHSVKEDEPVKMDPADFAVDLDYLRAYKDARPFGNQLRLHRALLYCSIASVQSVMQQQQAARNTAKRRPARIAALVILTFL